MAGPTWTVVVPVKRLAAAKTRLAGVAGEHRAALALAFALDTVTTALETPSVGQVVVVTDEPAAQSAAGSLGAVVVADQPDAGLNPALVFGAGAAAEGHAIAAVSADLPALTTDALDLALQLAADHPRSYVADAEGVGTTFYAARTAADFTPEYGPGSAARHAATAVALDAPGLGPLRRDVDTPADLAEAQALGVGPRTTAVLRLLSSPTDVAEAACG
jgi:2-phospho-L-lactate/phosphoenolpyruvate guanylyltransferase